MKILFLEDDREIGDFVVRGLKEEGFTVDWCIDGNEGSNLAADGQYDAMVLDIMVPGRDGLGILKQVRSRKNTTPVIITTARGEIEDRIEGLNLGADDYLPKPYYLAELVARLRAVWRRSAGDGMSQLAMADLTVNLMTREAVRGGRMIDLSPKEFALLVYFMESPGRVLTRTQIIEHVWEYQFNPGTNLVDVYVRKLRTKIDAPQEASLFETVRGVGYRMVAPDDSPT
ncbi:MAG: response regulator transcription factor [Verrucomicrobiota bacterium]